MKLHKRPVRFDTLNLEKLTRFILEAKIAVFDGKAISETLPDGGKVQTYQSGDYKYREESHGYYHLIGKKLVTGCGVPLWGMGYFGFIPEFPVNNIDPQFRYMTKAIFDFLKDANRQGPIDLPFIGPNHFSKSGGIGKLFYTNRATGIISAPPTIQDFKGEEDIRLTLHPTVSKSKESYEVFRQNYSGGLIRIQV